MSVHTLIIGYGHLLSVSWDDPELTGHTLIRVGIMTTFLHFYEAIINIGFSVSDTDLSAYIHWSSSRQYWTSAPHTLVQLCRLDSAVGVTICQ